jgi:hypothetical protein
MKISKAIEISTEALRRHYFLFMSLSEEGRPDCLGSGTYVLLNNKHYILTAAHVIKELLKIHQSNSFIGDTEIKRISWSIACLLEGRRETFGKFVCSGERDTFEHISQHLDVGILPLSPSVVKHYADLGFYPYDLDERKSQTFLGDGVLFVTGTSNYELQVDEEKRQHKSQSKVVQVLGDPATGNICRTDRNKERVTFSVFNDEKNPIEDYGAFSGGGLWKISLEDNTASLVGVIVEAISSWSLITCYVPDSLHDSISIL